MAKHPWVGSGSGKPKTPEGTKQCRRCQKVLPLTEFYSRKREEDGLHYNCKSCCKSDRAAERTKKRDRRNGVSNRQHYRASKQLGHDDADKTITLTELYKKANGICGVCGEWVSSHHASIDHIVPLSRGGRHTWDNVQLAHVRCNKVKGAN